jgi:hypothetical protein
MLGKLALSLLTLAVAGALTLRSAPQQVRATEIDPLLDTDDDFLPDCVEWAVLTSTTNPDTDGDQIPDFVEVVQRGTPRLPSAPHPVDQEMRVVITAPPAGTAGIAWMHLFLRLAEPGTPLTSFEAWLELPALPGIRVSFNMFALGPAAFRQRDAGSQGVFIQLSVPLVSANLLQQLLPCSLQAESVLGGRYIRSGVSLFDVQGSISTIVAFDQDRYAVQTIAPVVGGGGLSNRVCLLDLDDIGSGPSGTNYIVRHACCEDCNELECVLASCTGSIGWVITIPGGLGVLSAN